MQKVTLRVRAWGMGMLAAAVLTACGGGGGDSAPPPAPTVTVIPENLAITAPATSESATAVQFGNSASALGGLKFQWDFGDGSTSTEAAPSHSFASGGEFDVVLKVTNEAGTNREVRTKLNITNIANVKGLDCTGASNNGWCWQNPRPTGNRVNSVHFLTATTGWRGGENGEIFKTTDGGTTWVRQNTGITASIYGIKFFDANNGWATGAFGALLRTTDGGTTWNVSKLSDTSYSFDLATITPVDAKTVYVGRASGSGGNYYGVLFASKDGGVTWKTLTTVPYLISSTGKFWSLQSNSVRVSTDGGANYTSMLDFTPPVGNYFDTTNLVARDDMRAALFARSSNYDWTTQKYVYFETFRVTQDGGTTWTKVDVQSSGTSTGVQRLLSISADAKTLVALGGNGLLRSTDGGATWAALGVPLNDPYYYYYSYVSLGGNDIVASSYYSLALSEDGGQTWTRINFPNNQNSSSYSGDNLRRVDANTLATMDSQGATYLSKDKGQTWTKVVASVDSYNSSPSSLAFSDSKNGFMTDSTGRSFTTKDGGASWQVKSAEFGVARSVQFVNKTTGWLVGADGRLYKSTDGGQTWLTGPVTPGVYYSAVYFANENLGWSQRSYGGALSAYTKDGGKTWTEMTIPNGVTSMRFGEQAWVAIGGYGTVYVSTDSGVTWNAVYTGTSASLQALAFSDAKTVWAVGAEGTLLKSEDSGARWTVVKVAGNNLTLRDIKFASAKVGWIVGDGGLILATQDGGKTWRQQASGTALSLYSIQAVDINTAWIAGVNGLVLATGNGGN